MTLQERNLYQQIHPVRLATDWSTGIGACYLFWTHEIWYGVTLGFLPSLIVSLLVFRFANLERIKNSKFGSYFQRTYNKTVDLIRFAGFIILAGSSWWHIIPAMAVGFFIIVGTWTYGLFLPKKLA